MAIDIAMGRRICYFRYKHNLTQKQLGLLLGYSESTAEVRINQYENGIRRPKEATLQRLGEILAWMLLCSRFLKFIIGQA